MSILVYIESNEGEIKKSSLEVLTYAVELSKKMNKPAIGVAIGQFQSGALEKAGAYGIATVKHVQEGKLTTANPMAYASAIAEIAGKNNAEILLFPKSAAVDALVSRLAIKLKAGLVTGVTELPDLSGGFKVKKSIYTGKAFTTIEVKAAIKILSIAKNACAAVEVGGSAKVDVESVSVSDKDLAIKVTKTEKATGDILLPEADIVVSGGRGLKGPENWGIILELAKALGAATGCSKPVSDMDWRPHHEHVGQTGVKVSPNIYFAIGISGAIQHLAGVNSSKCIVVINKDPEAPFFKAADYGIVGDAFEVVPKLIEAAKKLN